eukprot:scaffold34676_cov176-Amphora_coffeaeformis.AAC.6
MEEASNKFASRFSEYWTFSIDAEPELSVPPPDVKESFAKDGFAVFPGVLDRSAVNSLNDRLEEILRGRYDRRTKPDKTPKLLKNEYRKENDPVTDSLFDDKSTKEGCTSVACELPRNATKTKISYAQGPLGFSGNRQNVKVLQLINVHKADSSFRQLAVSPVLGRIVAELAGWTDVGTRLAQDQIWAKPPGAPPLTFHRDSPYFMFTPADVVTVWVALDDMDDESIGPLQYVKGSHKWGDGRVGSSMQFFDEQGGMDLLQSAATRAGESSWVVESMAGLLAGGISIHDGRTWHGSGPNQSTSRPRRGLGLHFVPANVCFTADAAKSRLWKSYMGNADKEPHEIDLPKDDFPITWLPDNVAQ